MSEPENFTTYIENFKKLPLKEKQSIIIDQMKLLAKFTNNLCEELGTKSELIMNKELLDLKNENYTEDDFAEAVIVLVNTIQNSLCDATDAIATIADTIN